MPSPAIIATQLTDHSSRAYVLTMNGVDMNVTGQAASGWLVDVESVVVEETGPGQASALDFTVWDPNLAVTPREMAPVFFYDITNANTLFRGFVDSWKAKTQAIGRAFDIHCIGVEAILDWMVMTADGTVTAGARLPYIIQSLYAQASGVGVALNTNANDSVLVVNTGGSSSLPIGTFTVSLGLGELTDRDFSWSAGDTLGATIGKAIAATDPDSTGTRAQTVPGNAPVGFVTIDSNLGLRVWPDYGLPSDYNNLTVADATGSTNAAGVLDHQVDGGAVPHQVFVSGGNANGTGIVSDGSGITGPTAYMSDSTITTSAARDAAGLAFLAQYVTSTRGSLTRMAFGTPPAGVHPGSKLVLTNSQLGISAVNYVITSITKTFYAAKQDWQIAYGGRRPNPIGQIKRSAVFRAFVQR